MIANVAAQGVEQLTGSREPRHVPLEVSFFFVAASVPCFT